jgi:hypothetical protein
MKNLTNLKYDHLRYRYYDTLLDAVSDFVSEFLLLWRKKKLTVNSMEGLRSKPEFMVSVMAHVTGSYGRYNSEPRELEAGVLWSACGNKLAAAVISANGSGA